MFSFNIFLSVLKIKNLKGSSINDQSNFFNTVNSLVFAVAPQQNWSSSTAHCNQTLKISSCE